MRDSHRADAERLLVRAVEEEARRTGGRTDSGALMSRARAALDTMAAGAAEEYAAYTRALDSVAAGDRPLAERFSRATLGTPLLVTGVAAAAAIGADLALGANTGLAFGAGAVVAVAGTATTVAKVTASHWPAAHRRAAAAGQPGGAEQLRLQWLTALEVRGIRPYLDQQRMLTPASRTPKKQSAPVVRQLRGGDRSAAARTRVVLEQSFGHLPEVAGAFTGRRAELAKIAQWVHAARASTETRPTVVVLHGEPGSGRTSLAVRAAHTLKDQFRGACVVDLRGQVAGESPLPTRDALLHLLNRLGAPREQLLFREGASAEHQVRRLGELYHQHLTGTPVTVVLDDATDAEQVRTLVPERSDSLVIVTAREPLELPEDLAAWVHQLPVGPLDAAGAEELLREVAEEQESGPYDYPSTEAIVELCGGLPLALRVAGSALGARSRHTLAEDLGAYGPVGAVERALWLRYADQGDQARSAAAPPGARGPGQSRRGGGGLAAGDGRAGGGPAADRAGAGRAAHPRTGVALPAARPGAGVRAGPAAGRGGAERTAAQERLLTNYAELADAVIRMVDGKMSTRAGQFGSHGFGSLDSALRWLDDESSFITSALRHAEGVDQATVLHLLGALCDYCLLRGDLYRLGEISELTQAVDQGLLERSVQWRTGIAARQLGELDKARTTLSSVVGLYHEAQNDAGEALALCSLGITPAPPGQSDRGGGPARRGAGAPVVRGAGRGPGVVAARAGRRGAGPGRSAEGAGAAGRRAAAAPGGRVAARGRRGRSSSSGRCDCGRARSPWRRRRWAPPWSCTGGPVTGAARRGR